IDGEIAPGHGLLWRDSRIERREEIAMAHPDLAVPPGHAEVPGVPFPIGELHHSEAFPHQVDASAGAEQLNQLLVRQAVDFAIIALRFDAEQRVAHRPSHDQTGIPGGRKNAHNDQQPRRSRNDAMQRDDAHSWYLRRIDYVTDV